MEVLGRNTDNSLMSCNLKKYNVIIHYTHIYEKSGSHSYIRHYTTKFKKSQNDHLGNSGVNTIQYILRIYVTDTLYKIIQCPVFL